MTQINKNNKVFKENKLKKGMIEVECAKCHKKKWVNGAYKKFTCCRTKQLIPAQTQQDGLHAKETVSNNEKSNDNEKGFEPVQNTSQIQKLSVLEIEKVAEEKPEPVHEFKYRCGACRSPFDNPQRDEQGGIYCPICKHELNPPQK